MAKPAAELKQLVANGLSPREFLTELKSLNINHILQSSRTDLAQGERLISMIEKKYWLAPEELEKLWLSGTPSTIEFEFRSPETKQRALANLMGFVHRSSVLVKRARQIEMIASELALNAILSAQTRYFELTGRHFTFENGETCVLRFSFDEKSAVITCLDPLGSLRRENILDRLIDLFSAAQFTISENDVGQSGIGCKVIMDHSTDFFAFSNRLVKTLVGCRLPITGSAQAIETTPKNFHLYIYPSE